MAPTMYDDVLYMETFMETLILNLGGSYRREKMDGKDYLVTPIVMKVVGVHNGSKGPVLYVENHLKPTVPSWNHKPIVINHPPKHPYSANAKEVIENQQCGILLNTVWDERLKTEGWFDIVKCGSIKHGKEIIANIEAGKEM